MANNERTLAKGQYIPALFVAGDVLIVNLLFWLSLGIFNGYHPSTSDLRVLWVLLEVCALPMVFLGLRQTHNRRAIIMDSVMRGTLFAVATHALTFMSLIEFVGIPSPGWRFYLFFYGVLLGTLMIFQLIGNYVLKQYRRRGFNFTKVVIIVTGATARRLKANMDKDPGYGYRVLGFFDDSPADDFDMGTVRPIADLKEFVDQNNVRQIFFTLSGHHHALNDVIKIADDHVIDFYYVPQIPGTFSRRLVLNSIGSLPVLSVRRNPLKNIFNRGVKRAFDLVVSSIFLCFYPLIYIPVAIAIKLSSPGPVYFRQERTGYLGKPFVCLKFRTMRVNDGADRKQATADDPRKTRVGDFLRRTSLDELPQFINVWRGDMSVVGPRPHMLKHTEDYTRLVDSYMVRHAVKPGITGWAQVNGYRGITDQLWKMERRVEHDVWYIENWTLLLDIKIMVRTVLNALHGEKNAF